MINIISKSYNRLVASGPKKVVDNLVKGLDIVGYPYVINKRLDACKRLWIHDDVEALWQIKNLPPEIKVVIGPNLFVKPAQVPKGLDLSRAIYLQPSRWAADFWQYFGFKDCRLEVWPAGIDTDEFAASNLPKNHVLIYFKQRSKEELDRVTAILREKGIQYKILVYPTYSEREFKKHLMHARYIIWLGRHESQGIALQESLACNVPMLVCDVRRIRDWTASENEMAQFTGEESQFSGATCAEYFDGRCGIKIHDLVELPNSLDRFESMLQTFRPREYILENLSLERQAHALVGVYQKHFSLTFEQGLREKVLRQGKWQNDTWKLKAYCWAKDVIKGVLRVIR